MRSWGVESTVSWRVFPPLRGPDSWAHHLLALSKALSLRVGLPPWGSPCPVLFLAQPRCMAPLPVLALGLGPPISIFPLPCQPDGGEGDRMTEKGCIGTQNCSHPASYPPDPGDESNFMKDQEGKDLASAEEHIAQLERQASARP